MLHILNRELTCLKTTINQKQKQLRKQTRNQKTRIVVKEHFTEQGKTIDELMTEVIINKVKQKSD